MAFGFAADHVRVVMTSRLNANIVAQQRPGDGWELVSLWIGYLGDYRKRDKPVKRTLLLIREHMHLPLADPSGGSAYQEPSGPQSESAHVNNESWLLSTVTSELQKHSQTCQNGGLMALDALLMYGYPAYSVLDPSYQYRILLLYEREETDRIMPGDGMDDKSTIEALKMLQEYVFMQSALKRRLLNQKQRS